MKLMVLTCGVFPSEAEARRKMWIFLASCKKFGIEPHIYGMGDAWTIYRDIKINKQLAYLKANHGNYTHVLYTDGWDSFFTGSLSEITHKYEKLGSPNSLVSACCQLGNVSRMEPYQGVFDETERYRYPCVGGHISKIDYIVAIFERMLQNPAPTSDDCFDFYGAIQEGWFRPALDSACEIFQVTDDNVVATRTQDLSVRLFNIHTGCEPCILHLSGGFCHQAHGKDPVMVPWAQKLGIIE